MNNSNALEKYVLICNKCCLIELGQLLKKMNINVIETRDVKYNNVLILIFASNSDIYDLAKYGYFFHTNEKEALKISNHATCCDYITNICNVM